MSPVIRFVQFGLSDLGGITPKFDLANIRRLHTTQGPRNLSMGDLAERGLAIES